MEIQIQKVDRQEINLYFLQDSTQGADDITPFINSLFKIEKMVNKPGFRNEFSKEEKELWNSIFDRLIPKEFPQGLQYGGGDRVYIQKQV